MPNRYGFELKVSIPMLQNKLVLETNIFILIIFSNENLNISTLLILQKSTDKSVHFVYKSKWPKYIKQVCKFFRPNI